VALRAEVEEVIAPSVAGEFGVLPGHVPLLAAMKTGLVRYRLEGQMHEVAVGAGFVEIHQDTALLLTDRFMEKAGVDVMVVRERLKEVDEQLEAWQGEQHDAHRLELVEEEQWLAAQLELIGDPPVAIVLELDRSTDYRGLLPEGSEGGVEPQAAAEPADEADHTAPAAAAPEDEEP